MKKAMYTLAITVLLILAVILISPIHINTNDAKMATGVVTSVYASGIKDVVIKIAGINVSFCLNKPFAKNFTVRSLRDKVLGKKIKILYADSWTPLDPGCKKHIAEIHLEEDILFSDISK